MPLSFPSSPSVGTVSVQNGRSYQWDGTTWSFYGSVNAHAANHASGGSDAVSIAASQLSDSTATGRSLITAADAAAARTTLSVQPTDAPSFTGTVTSAGLLSLTGGQLQFPATVNLSSNANTLDDYEEGTWTPTFTATTTNPTVSYSASRFGTYVKIGPTVFFHCRVLLTAVTSAGSGNLRISGLPFTAAAAADGGSGSVCVGFRFGWTTNGPVNALVDGGTANIPLYIYGAAANSSLTVSGLSGTSDVFISGFYQTTA